MKPQARSRVGNGRDVLAGIDGRSVLARRIREVLGQFTADMGGVDISEARLAIAKRAAVLVAWCESMETSFVNGDDEFNVALYGSTVNNLRRLLETIGLERKARDITPSLSHIMSRHGGKAA